jgi:hypothetical protein
MMKISLIRFFPTILLFIEETIRQAATPRLLIHTLKKNSEYAGIFAAVCCSITSTVYLLVLNFILVALMAQSI